MELVDRLQQVQQYPPQLHLFCPRSDDDDHGFYYDEDVGNAINDESPELREQRQQKVKEALERKRHVLECMQILAFDGPDAEPYQKWLVKKVDHQMSNCDVCIRVYHKSRPELKLQLEDQYSEEDVGRFLDTSFDRINIERITRGLDQALSALRDTPPNMRGVACLNNVEIYAIFESLSCEPFLRAEQLLAAHFDEPFRLVQTAKRKLRLQNFVPAMARFLFSTNRNRQDWALYTWSKMAKPMTPSDFEWAIKDSLYYAMQRVQMHCLDVNFLPLFWSGVKVIVSRLDEDLIMNSLRPLDIDIYKLALEHFHINSEAFLDVVSSNIVLLERSPLAYRQAMGDIPASTVIEQVFGSAYLKQLLGRDDSVEQIEEVFKWINPFLRSVEGSNIVPACRTLINLLLGRFQSTDCAQGVRSLCEKTGFRVLIYTLRRLISSRPRAGTGQSTHLSAAIISDTLDLVEKHAQRILTVISNSASEQDLLDMALTIIKNTLQLDCIWVEMEKDMIATKLSLQEGSSDKHASIWHSIIKAIRPGNIALPCTTLVAVKSLVGVEPLQNPTSKDEKHYNDKLKSFSQPVIDVLEKLNDFSPNDLKKIFGDYGYASAIVHALFYSDESVYQAASELLKTMSLTDVRRDALKYTTENFYRNTLLSMVEATTRIGVRKAYTPMTLALKIGEDIVQSLCDPQSGYLRSLEFSDSEPVLDRYESTEKFWQSLWQLLKIIFESTEQWSNCGYDKLMMMDFCRDTMQFADQLFDQYGIFATAIDAAYLETDQNKKHSEIVKNLLTGPTAAFEGMVKWLRLRDEYLNDKAVSLTAKLLSRFKDASVKLPDPDVEYIENIVTGVTKSKLTGSQKAELERAMEVYTGRSFAPMKDAGKKEKQKDITSFFKFGERFEESRSPSAVSSDAEGDSELSKLIAANTKGADAFKTKMASLQKKPTTPTPVAQKLGQRVEEQKNLNRNDFLLRRRQEQEAEKKKRAAAVAKAKQNMPGYGAQPKGTGMYVSSDESEEDEDDLDKELFGLSKSKKDKPKATSKPKAPEIIHNLPFKKKRQVRSVKDMRARLAPDLTPLHKTILSWDYFAEGDFPPDSRPDQYRAVPNTFRTPNDYQGIFMPLLILEAWQGFVKSREEQTSKPYEVKIVNRASVDAYNEISSTMSQADNKEVMIGEGDIILLSKADKPSSSPEEPHCLARVFRIQRKKGHIEVSYRVMPGKGNTLSALLNPGGSVWGEKLDSITTLEREFGALMGLQYYDLCDEIIQARPSPLLSYTEKTLGPLISNYNLNTAQAKAVKSAIDNDAFTLIQGPPGSGKTKTIVAIVGAILSDQFKNQFTAIDRPQMLNGPGQRGNDTAPKKLLVCAPSNAAVDELVMRFKDGVKTLNGEHKKLKIVRLGRSEAINANVVDVTLEELVNKRLNVEGANGSADQRQKTQEIMKEHQAVSEQLRIAREALDKGDAKGDEAAKLKEEFDALRRRKALLGSKIDSAKDSENQLNRTAELNRRRAQQQVLDEAHVICATLSASGHDMFQSLNIEFETVVVDEAAQCVEMSALIPLKYGCAKCILVGDPKQLPPTVFSKEAAKFQYEQSLFVRMQGNHPNQVHLLDTQYRMHPEISVFPSKTFYDGRLLDGANMGPSRQRPWHANAMLAPYRFFDVQGQHQAAPKGHSLINIAEIEIAMLLYEKVTSDFRSHNWNRQVGIITPYKSQLRELKARFSRKYGPSILESVDFNTTDAFQGRESEVIIFSCVRASPAGGIGFLQDIRRMNVGLTRAKSSLWVLGNSQSLVRGEFWRKLVEDARARDRYTTGDVFQMIRMSRADGVVKWNLQGQQRVEDVEMKDVSITADQQRRQSQGEKQAVPRHPLDDNAAKGSASLLKSEQPAQGKMSTTPTGSSNGMAATPPLAKMESPSNGNNNNTTTTKSVVMGMGNRPIKAPKIRTVTMKSKTLEGDGRSSPATTGGDSSPADGDIKRTLPSVNNNSNSKNSPHENGKKGNNGNGNGNSNRVAVVSASSGSASAPATGTGTPVTRPAAASEASRSAEPAGAGEKSDSSSSSMVAPQQNAANAAAAAAAAAAASRPPKKRRPVDPFMKKQPPPKKPKPTT